MTGGKNKRERSILIAKLAILSRLICIALSSMSAFGLTSVVERSSIVVKNIDQESFVDMFILAHVQWDSLHFLNIATRGYETVLAHAFLPGLPLVMRSFSFVFPWGPADPVRKLALLGFVFVNISFVVAAIGLYKLSCYLLKSENRAFRATLFLVFTPASPFMSSLYNESPFAMLTFWGLYWLISQDNFFLGSLLLASATLFRSNGILALVFVIWFGVLKSRSRLIETVFGSFSVYLPYHLFSTWSKNLYCETGSPAPNWCATDSIYGYVQRTFWKVFPLGYYRLRNMPQFLLMLPALIVCICAAVYFLQDMRTETRKVSGNVLTYVLSQWTFPFLAQLGVLTAFTLFVANVQILTRLVVSCPLYFWTMERFTRGGSLLSRVVMVVHLVFIVIGPILHSVGFNWT